MVINFLNANLISALIKQRQLQHVYFNVKWFDFNAVVNMCVVEFVEIETA